MKREFKVGDLVKCIQSTSEYNGGPKKGEIFKVTSVDKNFIGFPLDRLDKNIYQESTRKGIFANWRSVLFEYALPEINETKFRNMLK